MSGGGGVPAPPGRSRATNTRPAPGERPSAWRARAVEVCQITATRSPGQKASAWRARGEGVPVHPNPAPGERPQHQHRADRGHQATAPKAHHQHQRRADRGPPGHKVNQASTWRARGGGVGVHPTPGQRRATGSPGQPKACPSGGGVGAWCQCIQRQRLASGHSTRAGQTVGNQVTAWHATSGGGVGVHGPCPRSPGHRLACPSGGGVPDRGPPGHKASAPAPGVPPAVEVCQIAATRSPGQRLTCPSGGGVPVVRPRPPGQRRACPGGGGGPVVPVHPMPEHGERPQHQRRADHGHQVTRPAPGVPEL